MNNGFTLVELLAVLFILGVITLVSVPNVITTNKKSKENDIKQFKKTVENAAEVYVETHLDLPEVHNLKNNGIELCISTQKLITSDENGDTAGLINSNLKNPKNNTEISSLYASVIAKLEDGEIVYTYREESCQEE